MHPATVAAVFGTVLVAELPDKTMLATIVLTARFKRPLAVWVGVATALTIQMVIAVAAGRLLDLLADRPVRLFAAAMFAFGAVVLWRSSEDSDEEVAEIDAELPRAVAVGPLSWWKVSATAFGIVFVAEWGDLTQLATASLAANGEAASVLVGAVAAMLTAAAIGVVAGRSLLRVLPERTLRRAAAVIFATLSVIALIAAIRG